MRGVVIAVLAGCTPDPEVEVTWHQDLAPIVVERCSGCHQSGGIAPFPLETYEQARDYAPVLLSTVEAGSMPPFLAQETDDCAPRLPWQHDLRLSPDEQDLLRRWVDADAPEGEPDTAAPIAPPEGTELERVDLVLELPEPITVEGTSDLHTCVVIDPGLTEDVYVVGRQITSGNPAVLHHLVSYVVEPGLNDDGTPQTKADLEAAIRAEKGVGIGGRYDCFGGIALETVETEMLDAWAPGGLPNYAPPGSGQPVDVESLVVLDVHYHPLGPAETDAGTKLSLQLADERPDLISQIALIGNFGEPYDDSEFGLGDLVAQPGEEAPEFRIPAGAVGHVEEMTWTWNLLPGFELRVYGAGTHMHYVGRDMRVTLERTGAADGEPAQECLIETPAWDFDWQRGYVYDAPYDALPAMRSGDVLRLRCVYDNSPANPFLAAALAEQGLDAPIDVELGEDTLDEMCLAAVALVYPNYE